MNRRLSLSLSIASAVLALSVMAAPAHAQATCPATVPNDSACITWKAPTQNTDGTAIPATGPTALKEFQLSRSVCNADGTAGTEVQLIKAGPTATLHLAAGLPPAKHCWRMRVSNNENTFSAWTATVSKTTTAPAPAKPKLPTLTIK